MNNVQLDQHLPEQFTIQANNIDNLAKSLEKHRVKYYRDVTIQGNVLKTEPSLDVFPSIENFMKDGGLIYSFKAIDILERMIEDLTK